MKSARAWDTPIRRRGDEAAPLALLAIGGKPTFERAVEQWLDEHISTKTGRPYSATTKTVARYNLTGGRLTAWREARGIRTAEDWTAAVAADKVPPSASRWSSILVSPLPRMVVLTSKPRPSSTTSTAS